MNSPEQSETFILLGTVTRPHGIQGELKVRPYTEKPGNFCRYPRLFLSGEDGRSKIEHTDVQARVNGNTVILRLKECTDRDRAEQFAGMRVWLAAADLPPAEANEFYLHSLEGKRARSATGKILGIVTGLLCGAQNVLVIRDDDQEYLVPAVRPFIVAIDENGIVVDLPPGLLEINR